MNPLWLKQDSHQLRVQVKVKPGSKQNAISFDATGGLQISLQACAQEGKANKMLVQYLAKSLGLAQKQIMLLRGVSSRIKVLAFKVEAVEQEGLINRLLEQSKSP